MTESEKREGEMTNKVEKQKPSKQISKEREAGLNAAKCSPSVAKCSPFEAACSLCAAECSHTAARHGQRVTILGCHWSPSGQSKA